MSNIYIQEPPTTGKVLLITSAGDLDIELWSKEAPKACRNFIQLCMEGYYNGTVFHRVVKDFIVQGGDPTGTGMGGESIYGKPFKDEIHTRLRFVRRGLVAMANAGPNDNGSQFFITMGPTPELQNKHTIFGKITGNTVYNIGKLQEVEADQHDRPYHPHKVKSAHILSNPFEDIVPRINAEDRKSKESKEEKVKSKSKATKNYKLLSFGDEAEEQEEEVDLVSKDSKGKGKSSHDLIDDPTLSAETTEIDSEEVRQRLAQPPKEKKAKTPPLDEESEDKKKISRTEELRLEAKRLKRDLKGLKSEKSQSQKDEPKEEPEEKNEVIAAYKAEIQKYKKAKIKKGSGREEATLALLAKFQSKLETVKKISGDYSDEEEAPEGETEAEAAGDMSWMTHKLIFEDEERKRKVIDANVQELDRYEIYDPRNPLTKRRRENSKQTMKEKKHKT